MSSISFDPFLTSVAQGMFNVSADGLRQGTAYQSPNARYNLRGGILAADEVLPMWGGVGVYMNVPTLSVSAPRPNLGPVMGRASALTGAKRLQGFSVFDQNYSMVNSPQSPVPLSGSGGQVNAYALGSGARLAVAVDAALISLEGDPIASQVSWDFVNQRLVPYIAAPIAITSGTYVSATGLITLVMPAPITFGPGDSVILDTLTGTGAFAALNGTWTAVAPTSGTTVTLAGPVGAGAATITGGNLNLGSGPAAALPCTVLSVQATNCITVSYNAVTGFATWNYNGACAVIQI